MELDITTLEFTNIFLSELEIQGFISYKLVFKVISKITGKITYFNFATLQDFQNNYSTLLNDNKPNKYCKVGDFIFLENIKFVNNAVSYESNIYYYNIASGTPFNKIDVKYNNNKNAFYAADIKKFVAYLEQALIEYYETNTMLMNTRNSTYVDACYVDPGYVSDAGFNPQEGDDTGGLE